MARQYDVNAVLGEDFEFELTPDVLAYELSMDFSSQVILQCDRVGINFTELASLLGISTSTLSEKLNGQNLTLKSIASMAIALGCDVKAPELIAEPEVACSMDASWSLPFTLSDVDLASDLNNAWPMLEPTHQAETTVIASERSSHNYSYTEKLWKAA